MARPIVTLLGAVLVASLVLGILLVPPLLGLRESLEEIKSNVSQLKESLHSKDLNKVSQNLEKTKASLQRTDRQLGRLIWVRPIPILGRYVRDAKLAIKAAQDGSEAGQIIVSTLEPYADLIGLTGSKQAMDGAKTAQDRINFLVETFDKITPQLDKIGGKIAEASQNLEKIDPNYYPENIKGFALRKSLVQAQDLFRQANTLTHDAKPLLEAAPYILGSKEKRTYLVLFQNDAELRPTGGFMTAYAIINVEKGKAKPQFSEDIYSLDARYKPTLEASPALVKYVYYPYQDDPRWRLRDMNLDPDFKVSMDRFLPEFNKTKPPKVDGVIAVDTQLLVKLLGIIGKIGVPGYGNFSAETDPRCNCPNVVYELESIADAEGPIVWDPLIPGKIIYRPPYSENRKGIIGPLMNSILANAIGQPKEKVAQLFEVAINSIQEKHILMYFTDPQIQSAVESFNMAGRLRENAGDFLYLVSSNMAGRKTNLYIQSDLRDEIKINDDGSAAHTLTINLQNPQKRDGWLNDIYRNWFRVYVPKGSQLISGSGSEVKIEQYEELGKSVFAGFVTVQPSGGVAKLTIEYKTPRVTKDHRYSLLIQKQPGSKNDPYVISINGKEQEFDLVSDREITERTR